MQETFEEKSVCKDNHKIYEYCMILENGERHLCKKEYLEMKLCEYKNKVNL